MAEMIRKQFYIYKRQQLLLTHLSQKRGVSEAEIVRQAIDREAEVNETTQENSKQQAWEAIMELVAARGLVVSNGEPYSWDREEIYAERENKFKM